MAFFSELFKGVRNVWANMRLESLVVDEDITVGGSSLKPKEFDTVYEAPVGRFTGDYKGSRVFFRRLGPLVEITFDFENNDNVETTGGNFPIAFIPSETIPAEFLPVKRVVFMVAFRINDAGGLLDYYLPGSIQLESDGQISFRTTEIDGTDLKLLAVKDGLRIRTDYCSFVYEVDA